MSQQPWSDWTTQVYHQPSMHQPNNRSSQYHQYPDPYHAYHAQSKTNCVQPSYSTLEAAPVVAELPASVPLGLPTSTLEKQLMEDEQIARKLSAPDQQLTEDERIARQLQQLEVEEANRPNSNASQQQRPISMALQSPQYMPSLLQQRSSQSLRTYSQIPTMDTQHNHGLVQQQYTNSLRPHSQGFSDISWSSGSLGPPPSIQSRYVPLSNATPNWTLEGLPHPLPLVNLSNLPEVVPDNPPQTIKPLSDSVSLSAYLEEHLQVPYPLQWRLSPIIKMYHARANIMSTTDWLDTPDSSDWLVHRQSDYSGSSSPASYSFTFKTKGGKYRDPRFSWVMQCNVQEPKNRRRHRVWTYELRLDLNSGVRKTEFLNPSGETNILTTYVHAPNYDSLRFISNDGKSYLWVSHMPLGTTKGSRYDTLRHALFVATGNHPDPLYGDIVADHTYWDGFINETEIHKGVICIECQTKPIVGQRWRCKACSDHNICGLCWNSRPKRSIEPACNFSLTCLPDETLCIRSTAVDHALVIATLQILKDWQKLELRRQKGRDPKGFALNEEAAREHNLGKLSYWRGSDSCMKTSALQRVRSRAENVEAIQNPNEITSALENLADAGLAMAAQGQKGGHGEQHSGGGYNGYQYGGGGGAGGGGG